MYNMYNNIKKHGNWVPQIDHRTKRCFPLQGASIAVLVLYVSVTQHNRIYNLCLVLEALRHTVNQWWQDGSVFEILRNLKFSD